MHARSHQRGWYYSTKLAPDKMIRCSQVQVPVNLRSMLCRRCRAVDKHRTMDRQHMFLEILLESTRGNRKASNEGEHQAIQFTALLSMWVVHVTELIETSQFNIH